MLARTMIRVVVVVTALAFAACSDNAGSISYKFLAERAASHERLYPGPCARTYMTDGVLGNTVTYQYDDAGRNTSSLTTSPTASYTYETTSTYDADGNLVRSSIVKDGVTTTLTVYTEAEDVPGARRGEVYLDTDTPAGTPVKVLFELMNRDGMLVYTAEYDEPPFETSSRVTNYTYTDGRLTRKVIMASPDDEPRLVTNETWEYNDDGYVALYSKQASGSDTETKYTYSNVETDLTLGQFTFSTGDETLARGYDVYDVFGNRLMSSATQAGSDTEFQYTYECFF